MSLSVLLQFLVLPPALCLALSNGGDLEQTPWKEVVASKYHRFRIEMKESKGNNTFTNLSDVTFWRSVCVCRCVCLFVYVCAWLAVLGMSAVKRSYFTALRQYAENFVEFAKPTVRGVYICVCEKRHFCVLVGIAGGLKTQSWSQ